METKMKKLTIEMSKWLRGNPEKSALMLRDKMCCLGFDAIACGFTPDEIAGIGSPSVLYNSIKTDNVDYFKKRLTDSKRYNSIIVVKAMQINDSPSLSDEERIIELIPILKELGYDEVEFIP